MKRHTEEGLTWLTFDHLEECSRLVHGVFLRHGGVSTGAFGSLNFGVTQGDVPEKVFTNRQRALEALKIPQYCHLYQQHGSHIVDAKSDRVEQGDALTTSSPDLGLLILHADCQAAIFYDPIHHALSNVHCGWRGNVHNIYKKTIDAMHAKYGSRPEDLLVGVSPSLGPKASEFINYRCELPESFYPFQVKMTYFDLWDISRWQLTECGVLDEHIEIAEMCTYASPEDCFSYRRIKASGRHGTLTALK